MQAAEAMQDLKDALQQECKARDRISELQEGLRILEAANAELLEAKQGLQLELEKSQTSKRVHLCFCLDIDCNPPKQPPSPALLYIISLLLLSTTACITCCLLQMPKPMQQHPDEVCARSRGEPGVIPGCLKKRFVAGCSGVSARGMAAKGDSDVA